MAEGEPDEAERGEEDGSCNGERRADCVVLLRDDI